MELHSVLVVKTQAEAYEAKVNAAKQAKSESEQREILPRKLEACRKTKSELRDQIHTLQDRIYKLRDALDHLKSLQDVEEGAAFLALLRDKPILKETLDRYEQYIIDHGSTESFIDVQDDPLESQYAEQDTYVPPSFSSSSSASAEASGTPPLPLFNDPCEDPNSSMYSCFVHTAESTGSYVLKSVKSPFVWSGWTKMKMSIRSLFFRLSPSEELTLLRTDASKARSKLSEAESSKREMETKLNDMKKKEEGDLGMEGEWEKLWDTCVSVDSFEYTYEICFFGTATQKPRNGHGGTSLG
jgi:chaperonin cofactor prefoldin